MTADRKFVEKLKLYRYSTHKTPQQMSAMLGMSVSLYNSVEAGSAQLPAEAMSTLIRKTGIPSGDWTSADRELPDPLPVPSRPGRKSKNKTPDPGIQAEQRRIAARLRQIIAEYYENSQQEFASVTKLHLSELSRLLGNKREISPGRIMQISRLTGISARWLQTGEGQPMQKDSVLMPVEKHEGKALDAYLIANGIRYSRLAELMNLKTLSTATGYRSVAQFRASTKAKILEALGASETDVFGSKQPVRTVRVADDVVTVPYVPESLRMGISVTYRDAPAETVAVRRSLIPAALEAREWWAFEVNGDQMGDRFQAGDRLLGYCLEKTEYPLIVNRVVAVLYAGDVYIKRIKQNNFEADGGVWVHSDSQLAEPWFARADMIDAIFRIEKFIEGRVR